MAERKWTDGQREVIAHRTGNLLVSAAAGAGKTAVLVERIIQMISDTEHPLDIDKLLVMTFTNAAAAEMRDRIGAALDEMAEANPEDDNIRRQQRLLHSASITTIDSFCMSILREYYYLIDLDPSFRVGEEAELKLLRDDVLAEVMEEFYAEGAEDFLCLVNSYGSYKSDEDIVSMVLKLYAAANAATDPDEWLNIAEKSLNFEQPGDIEQAPWMEDLLASFRAAARDALNMASEARRIAEGPGGPVFYVPALMDDEVFLGNLAEKSTYRGFALELEKKFVTLGKKKKVDPEADEDIKERVSKIRKTYRTLIDKIRDDFFFQSIEESVEDLKFIKIPMTALIRLTRTFMERLAAVKREKNIIDFTDSERFALLMLRAGAAAELHENFSEIIIDEYQDSNLLQEEITNLVAGADFERPYTFMVGDVKQSIYGFRNARPDLFMGKRSRYSTNSEEGKCILLDANFRSRDEVIDSVNAVFAAAMIKEIGGVEYTKEEYLVRKADFPKADSDYKTELLLIDKNVGKGAVFQENEGFGSEDSDSGEEADNTDDSGNSAADENLIITEAKAVAARIKQLIAEGFRVRNGKEGTRPCKYEDIVILLRSMSGTAETYLDVLTDAGIPVYADTSSGFFATTEVRTVLDMLRVLDNPRQDIPLASVLHSAAFFMTADELAEIRISAAPDISFYDALLQFPEGREGAAAKKAVAFIEMFSELREYAGHSSMEELLDAVYRKTGFYRFVLGLPGGDRRGKNLDMLMATAASYEVTGYHGLFSFIRYAEKLIERNIDYGEAASFEGGNAVRIMTMHKSKGLQFPIVFLGGMGKGFNMMDMKSRMLCHSEYGIAAELRDRDRMIKSQTVVRAALKKLMQQANVGEELRVLYVAMTRAEEKLIMVGGIDFEKAPAVLEPGERFSAHTLASLKGFMGVLYPVCAGNEQHFTVHTYDPSEYGNAEDDLSALEQKKYDDYAKLVNEQGNPGEYSRLKEIRDYVYPYVHESDIPVKVSVSELKKQSMLDEFGEDLFSFTHGEKNGKQEETEKSGITGAERGTLYHKIMQFIDFGPKEESEVTDFLGELVSRDIISPEEKDALNPATISKFTRSAVAARMKAADDRGLLHREQPFVMQISAERVNREKYAGLTEPVPIQGIIDVFFKEDDGYVILDYKTDNRDGETLARMYREQLKLYSEAVCAATGENVKECILYSLKHHETIVL